MNGVTCWQSSSGGSTGTAKPLPRRRSSLRPALVAPASSMRVTCSVTDCTLAPRACIQATSEEAMLTRSVSEEGGFLPAARAAACHNATVWQ